MGSTAKLKDRDFKLAALKFLTTMMSILVGAILFLIAMLPRYPNIAASIATAISALCVLLGGLVAGYIKILKSLSKHR